MTHSPRSGPAKLFFLTETHIRRLYKQNVSRTAEPQHITRLQSALDSPQQHFLYNNQRDPFILAGLLTERIILNHPYGNGNKRSGCIAGDMFLKLNGWKVEEKAVTMELRDAYVRLAKGEWSASEFADFCRGIAKEESCIYSKIQQLKRGHHELAELTK